MKIFKPRQNERIDRPAALGIMGKSQSGKSMLLDYIDKETDYKKVILVTTRPRRKGEVNGKDYYFWPDYLFEEMERDGAFVAVEKYRGWCYGVLKWSIKKGDKKVLIVTPRLLKQLKKNGIELTTVLLKVDGRSRMGVREKSWETYRRRISDGFRFWKADVVVKNKGFEKSPKELWREIRRKVGAINEP